MFLAEREKRFAVESDELFPTDVRFLMSNMNDRILAESWVLFHGTLQSDGLMGQKLASRSP
jgi:hypothetical protein